MYEKKKCKKNCKKFIKGLNGGFTKFYKNYS